MSERILLVEDEVAVRNVYQLYLEQYGTGQGNTMNQAAQRWQQAGGKKEDVEEFATSKATAPTVPRECVGSSNLALSRRQSSSCCQAGRSSPSSSRPAFSAKTRRCS